MSVIGGCDPTARYRALVQALECCPGEPIVVARTQALAHELGRRIAVDLPGRPVQVYSWRRWVEHCWLAVGDGRTPVDESVRTLFIAELLAARRESNPSLPEDLLDRVGGRRMLATFVSSWPSAAIDGAQRGSGVDALLDAAARYTKAVRDAGYIELSDILEALPDLGPQVGPLVVVAGFLTLTDPQVRLLSSLADRTEVAVELALDGESEATRVNRRVVDSIGAQCETSTRTPAPSACSLGDAIARLVGSSDAGDGAALEAVGSGAVTVSVAEGAHAEVSLIADMVEREMAQGVSADNICVIVSETKTMASSLSAEFERRNLPHAINATVPLSSTGLGGALLSLAQAAVALRRSPSSPGGQLLGSFITSVYSGMSGVDACELDARVRFQRTSVARTVEMVASSKSRRPGFGPDSALAELGRIAERSSQLGKSPEEVEPVRNAVVRSWKMVADHLLSQSLGAVQTSWWGSAQDLAAHGAFSDILAALRDSDAPFDESTLVAQIRQGSVMVGAPTNASGLVTIAPPRAIIGRDVQVAVLAGLSAQSGGTSATLSPERRLATELGLEPMPDLVGERMLRDFALLGTPTSRLHIVWRSVDESAGRIEPAPLLDEVFAGLGVRPSTVRIAARRVAMLREVVASGCVGLGASERVLTDAEICLVVERLVELDGISEREARVATIAVSRGSMRSLGSPEVAAVRSAAHRGREAAYLAPQDHAPKLSARGLAPIQAPPGFWAGRTLSPSDIGAYVQCPYRWFTERFIGARELDDEYGASTTGEVVHEVLERFYVHWMRVLGNGALTEDSLPEARAVFDSIKQQVVSTVVAAHQGSWSSSAYAEVEVGLDVELAWRIIARDATAALLPKTGIPLVPTYFEWKFGRGASHPDAHPDERRELDAHPDPIYISGVPLAGSIDRIDMGVSPDTGEQLLAVIDYKSGKDDRVVNTAQVVERGRIQALIYLIAASQILGATPAMAAYAPYRTGATKHQTSKERLKAKGKMLSDDEFDAVLELVRDQIGDVWLAMQSGLIEPKGHTVVTADAGCEHCAHRWCPNHPKGV